MFQCTHAACCQDVARGVSRLLIQEGFSPILEFTLANGRRLDVAALGADGTLLGVEIKVAIADLKGDTKWPDYLEFCELFYFAIPPDFPDELVPRRHGPDRRGPLRRRHRAAFADRRSHASRRKAVTLRFAKVAAERLAMTLELAAEPARILGDISTNEDACKKDSREEGEKESTAPKNRQPRQASPKPSSKRSRCPFRARAKGPPMASPRILIFEKILHAAARRGQFARALCRLDRRARHADRSRPATCSTSPTISRIIRPSLRASTSSTRRR